MRADYWKSQDKKYCDFCKCWIADNRPSVEFHEKGRRHQENVKKRLRTISKNSVKAQKESDRMDATLKKMEQAAMSAYRKDVQNNADLTSVAINKKLQDDNLAISSGSKKVWKEAKSPEGRTYFWNTLTNESAWKAPQDGYESLLEQRDGMDKETAKQMKALDNHNRTEALLRLQADKKIEDEEKARAAREKMKARRVVDDVPEPVYAPIIEPGKNDPYGGWQTVRETPQIDYQLPEQPAVEYTQVVEDYYEPEIPVREFKEKTVESLDFEGESSFKKRKIKSGAKRNTRQRLDDD